MGKEYEIAKITGVCAVCGRQLRPKEEFVAALRELPSDFERQDFCVPCWQQRQPRQDGSVLAVWRSTVPRPQEKKKRFVDDDLIINFFERLDGAADTTKLDFRFVLALVLMRKKLLVYDRMEKLPDGQEVWLMHLKGSDDCHKVVNPRMDDQEIAEVSKHLGEILPDTGPGADLEVQP